MEQPPPRPRTIPDNFVSPELSWKRWAERPLQEERRQARRPKNRAVRRKPTQAEYRAGEDIISERRVLERTRLFTGDGPKRYNFSREDFKSRGVRILRRMTGRPQEEVRAALIRARSWPGSWRDTAVSDRSPFLDLPRLMSEVTRQPICVRYFWDDNGCLTNSLKVRDQINSRLDLLTRAIGAVMAPPVEKEPRDYVLPNGAGPHRRAPRRPDPSPKKPVLTPMKQVEQRRVGVVRAVIHPGAISPIQRLPPVVVFLSVMRNVWRSR